MRHLDDTANLRSVRGTLLHGRDGAHIVVTVHPSYLLRLTDEADKAREYNRFVTDLRLCAEHLRTAA